MSAKIDSLFDFWLKHNMNVLLEGLHGFGKTERVIETFERNGLKWRYFSASTMDPWVDFVGVPERVDNPDGSRHLELIRPRDFEDDSIEALFFDEFNRAPKKVRNAVMELIQFKSINGRKFKNLKVVWAAINPHDEDDTYDVEKLDPAQIDRFHVRFEVPNVPDARYFRNRYGEEISKPALEWWSGIPRAIRKDVSARRLQYTLDCYQNGGDITYMLPSASNPAKLVMALSSGSVVEALKKLIDAADGEGLRKFLNKENNFEVAIHYLKNSPTSIGKLFPFIDEERKMRLASELPSVMQYVILDENLDDNVDILKALVAAGTLPVKEEKRIKELMNRKAVLSSNGATVFTPIDPKQSGLTHKAVMNEIKRLGITLQGSSVTERREVYTFMTENLTTPQTISECLDVLVCIYRIIEREKEVNLNTRFTMLIPMLNLVLQTITSLGHDYNNPVFISSFKQSNNYMIERRAKVQGYIDLNEDRLIDRRKKPIIMS